MSNDVNLYGADYVASIASLIRLWLFSNSTSRSRFWAWVIGFIAGGGWLVVSILVGSWAMIAINTLYILISIRGVIREKNNGVPLAQR